MVAKLLAAQALSLTHARSFVAGLYTMILGFISLAIDRFRKLDVTDIALFKWIMLGFGFFLGLCAPRRWRKFKFVILILTLAGAAYFLFRLFAPSEVDS